MFPESEGSTGSWWERRFHKEGSYTAEPDPTEVSTQRLPNVSRFGNKEALRDLKREASVTKEQVGWSERDPEDSNQADVDEMSENPPLSTTMH